MLIYISLNIKVWEKLFESVGQTSCCCKSGLHRYRCKMVTTESRRILFEHFSFLCTVSLILWSHTVRFTPLTSPKKKKKNFPTTRRQLIGRQRFFYSALKNFLLTRSTLHYNENCRKSATDCGLECRDQIPGQEFISL